MDDNIDGEPLNELSPEGWSQVNDSRANPDADLDYYEMLSLEIMAHCDGQTDEELEVIALTITAPRLLRSDPAPSNSKRSAICGSCWCLRRHRRSARSRSRKLWLHWKRTA
jgi:hypothetical protein